MTSPRLRKRRGSVAAPLMEELYAFVRIALFLTIIFIIAFASTVLVRTDGSSRISSSSRSSSAVAAPTNRLQEKQDSTNGAHAPPPPPTTKAFVDLWPDDRHSTRYRRSLPSRIPVLEEEDVEEEGEEADNNNHNNLSIQRVALVHPPGRLGDVFVEYITRVVHLQPQHETNGGANEKDGEKTTIRSKSIPPPQIELVSTVQLMASKKEDDGTKQPYTKIIRLATLPVLLEAVDILLAHPGSGPMSTAISEQDILDLVRQLVRWQCHVTNYSPLPPPPPKHLNDQQQHDESNSNNDQIDTAVLVIPLLTITLDRMMGFSSMTTKKVQSFLGLPISMVSSSESHEQPSAATKKKRPKKVDMDDLSLIVMEVVDSASSLVQEMMTTMMQDLHIAHTNNNTKNNVPPAAINGTINSPRRLDEMVQLVIDEELTAMEDYQTTLTITTDSVGGNGLGGGACRPITIANNSSSIATAILKKMMA